mmetsp:Transcript_27339/g.52036  ORF Transcript_27339/g.52036 Transcript_27339/m.52036 type:complete len:94 (+) Transcript_27339:698-979(+)
MPSNGVLCVSLIAAWKAPQRLLRQVQAAELELGAAQTRNVNSAQTTKASVLLNAATVTTAVPLRDRDRAARCGEEAVAVAATRRVRRPPSTEG